MAYRVRVEGQGLKRDFGVGEAYAGRAYVTRRGAERRARVLSKIYTRRNGFTVRVTEARR